MVEYGLMVLTLSDAQLNRMEGIQIDAMRAILGFTRDISLEAMRFLLGLSKPTERHRKAHAKAQTRSIPSRKDCPETSL